MTKELHTHVLDFDDCRRTFEQINKILVSGGTVNEIQRGGVRIGDRDIRILDFDAPFILTESPDRDIDISIRPGSFSDTGILSVASADFNVTAGAVELKDTVVKSVGTDFAGAAPVAHSFDIKGGSGITTSGAGTDVTIALTAAITNLLDFFNGTFIETFDALVTSDGATITMSLEQSGGGDLTMVFSDEQSSFDCTPAATISLTAGTDIAPRMNWIYILESTRALTKSTSGWPSGVEFIKVGVL